jgi:predicted ArsR family transcriptional regulator
MSKKHRKPLEIKKEILNLLKNKELSLRQLESKINTSNQTIKNHLEELVFFGKVELVKHSKHEKTGRPYTSVRLR